LNSNTVVSVVIPCYNEEAVLELLHEKLNAIAQSWGTDYEIILVNDGSTDRSAEIMDAMAAADPHWKMVHLTRNFGHQLALWAGLRAAQGAAVAVLDADLQDPPELLVEMLKKWTEGFDVVYGIRQQRKENLIKRSAYFFFYRLLACIAETDVPLDSGDFCVMDQAVVRLISSVSDRRPFIRGLRAWVGFRQVGLPYERRSRAAGEVKYTYRKLLQLALNGILSSSIRPLRMATLLGLVISCFAFLGAVFTLLQRIFAEQFQRWGLGPVPGFATIVISILFLGGVQLLCIGVVGEYVGRIYENVTGRPACIVQRTVGVKKPLDNGVQGTSSEARGTAL
jgi:dolichol-phosphate mannosyltransferase